MSESMDERDDELEALARNRAEAMPAGAVGGAAPRVPAKLPGWTRFGTPLLLVTIVVLLAIGVWAVGAVIYVHNVDPIAPEDVRYPLLRWSDDVGTAGGYSPESRIFPVAMLGAFPLAILLVFILVYLRKQQRRVLSSSAEMPPHRDG